MTAEKKAGRLLSFARAGRGLSQEHLAARISIALGEPVNRQWVQWLEAGPRCPLKNHRRLWAVFAELGVEPGDYLEALGLKGRGEVWK